MHDFDRQRPTVSMAEKAQEFLKGKLLPDLAAAVAERNSVLVSIAELADLKTTVQQLRVDAAAAAVAASGGDNGNNRRPFTRLVDLGADQFAEAEALDTQHIFLKIGLGFVLQVTLDEALPLIDEQRAVLAG